MADPNDVADRDGSSWDVPADPGRGRVGAHAPAQARDRFPDMTAQREMDRQEHIRRARGLGATRRQAARHADEEVGGH